MTSRPTGGRLLGVVAIALAAAALALWASSRGTWLTATWDTPLRGRVVATATGADTEPVLVAWALLALAAVAGVVATSGWGRRVVGVLVAVAGLWALVAAALGLAAPAPEALPATARAAGRAVEVDTAVGWPLLAALGAVLMLGAGLVTAWRAGDLPRLGARYDAPGSPTHPNPTRPVDPDRAQWEALDAGRDPTVSGSGDGPGQR